MIRLRQVALIAPDLDPVVDELREAFGLEVCFHDPGVAEFGLRNALLLVGDQFIEVLSPTRDDTTVGRLLAKRGGAGGYMAIYEVDDLDARVEHLAAHGVRIVWQADLPDIRGRHLHPSDVGGTLVSIDQPTPTGSWRWGGPSWPTMTTDSAAVTAIARITIGATDPGALGDRWAQLGLSEAVEFVTASDRGDGLDGVDLQAADRSRVGEQRQICGVVFRLVS